MKTLVVIPTFNEADNIEPLLLTTWQHAPNAHVLIVDDGSPDGTAGIVRRLQQNFSGKLHLLERSGKLGLGTAYIAGFRWALERSYDYVIEMDADFSHSPETLPQIMSGLGTSAVIVGSRYISGGGTKNWSFIRKLISIAGSFYARTILCLNIRDLTGGFNGWRAEVLRAINLDEVRSEGYSFQIELKYRAAKKGFSVQEIPILFNERRAGHSKMSGTIVIEAMYRVWQLRLRV